MPFEVTTLYRDRTENQTEQARLHREEDERFEKAQKSEDTNFKDAKKAEDQRFAEVITKAESQFTATMDQADRNRRPLRQMSFSAGIVPPQNDPGVVSIKQGIVDFLASEGGPPSMGSQVASNWSVIHPVAYEGGSPFGLATVEVPDSSELYPKAESALRVLLGFIQISLDFSRQPNREKAVRAGSMGDLRIVLLSGVDRPAERVGFGSSGKVRLDYILKDQVLVIQLSDVTVNQEKWFTNGAITSARDLGTCKLSIRLANFYTGKTRIMDTMINSFVAATRIKSFSLQVQGDREFDVAGLKDATLIEGSATYYVRLTPRW